MCVFYSTDKTELMSKTKFTKMDTTTEISSPVREFYTGKSIFITGATGFMGKVLVEKLLRSCTGIKAIYILIRSKDGSSVKARVRELLSVKLFDRIKAECPDVLEKIIPIEGDIGLTNLGICENDEKKLCDEISVAIHSAAYVNFFGKLKKIVHLNTIGTHRVVQLCEKMKKLESFVFVSSLSAFCNQRALKEIVYPVHVDPWNVMSCFQWMDESMLEAIAPKLMGDFKLTYSFSKAMAEHIVASKSEQVPTAIFRPGLVCPTLREPVPGWIDNAGGLADLCVAMQRGILHTLYVPDKLTIPLVPCDSSINALICIAWETAVQRSNTVKVYNCTSPTEKSVKCIDILRYLRMVMYKYPISSMVWYPSVYLTTNQIEDKVLDFLWHYIPAVLADIVQVLAGKKRKFTAIHKRAVKKMKGFLTILDVEFSLTDSTNTYNLKKKLTPADQKLFGYDIYNEDEVEYTDKYVGGLRQHYLKEDPSSIPVQMKRLRMYYYAHIALILFFLFVAAMMFYKIFYLF